MRRHSVPPDELIRWRTLVNEKKSLLSHRETEERKENSACTDMHLKGKKVDWPTTITQDTWYHFLKIWKREEVFIVGDYYKVKHLLSHMGPDEKAMFLHEENPAKIMT